MEYLKKIYAASNEQEKKEMTIRITDVMCMDTQYEHLVNSTISSLKHLADKYHLIDAQVLEVLVSDIIKEI